MADIHPTAIVDEQVKLADDVIVGPGCIITGDVTIGSGTQLVHRVSLNGPMTIGRDNMLYPNVCIGFAPQDLKYNHNHDGAGVIIGDANLLREGVTIHRATGKTPTTVGNQNYLMCNSHLGHDVQIGDDCMLANNTLLAGHVNIGDRVVFGGSAAVHQFVRIGRIVMHSGLTGMGRDVPPFCTVYIRGKVGSLNLVGLRRAGLRDHIKPLKKAFDILFRRHLANQTAAKQIEAELGDDSLCMEMAKFVQATQRGICPYEDREKNNSDTSNE